MYLEKINDILSPPFRQANINFLVSPESQVKVYLYVRKASKRKDNKHVDVVWGVIHDGPYFELERNCALLADEVRRVTMKKPRRAWMVGEIKRVDLETARWHIRALVPCLHAAAQVLDTIVQQTPYGLPIKTAAEWLRDEFHRNYDVFIEQNPEFAELCAGGSL